MKIKTILLFFGALIGILIIWNGIMGLAGKMEAEKDVQTTIAQFVANGQFETGHGATIKYTGRSNQDFGMIMCSNMIETGKLKRSKSEQFSSYLDGTFVFYYCKYKRQQKVVINHIIAVLDSMHSTCAT